MKFTAKNVGLLNGLSPVIGVALTGEKSEYPDAYKVSLTAKGDSIVAEAFNGNVAISNILKDQVNLDYIHAADGTITVDATDLNSTLKSFDKDEVLQFELKGNELSVVPLSDNEKLQTLPFESRQIEMPKVSSKFDTEIAINKAVLVNAMSKVLFAIGFEKFKPEFLYWKLAVEPKKLRVVCGDGGRFPLYEIEGDNFVQTTGSTTLLIYKDHNPALQKAIGLLDGETVEIKEFANSKNDDGVSDQFVLTIGSATIVLVGHDPGTKWPDENAFLARTNNYRFITKASDWAKEMDGLWATYNEDVRNQNLVHSSILSFDTKKGILTIKTENTMKAVRKVKIIDSSVAPGFPENVEFKCITSILRDAILKAEGSNIQMELQEGTKPMIAKYFAGDTVADGPLYRVNSAAGTKEQYFLFFGAYNKKKA